jgi:hypothetical protein
MLQKLYRLWMVLMIISGGVALAFLGVALASIWKFINFSEETSPQTLAFHVQEVSCSRFALVGEYTYEVAGRPYKGKTVFENPVFLNRFAAESYPLVAFYHGRKVAYMKRNPSLSSLENPFPYKHCLQALVTIGVFLYFYFARGLLIKFISHLADV